MTLHNNETTNGDKPISPDESICSLLQGHPFIGASIVDYDGKILWSNARAKLLYFNDSVLDYEGKYLTDYLPDALVEERLDFLRQVCDSRRPAYFRQIRLGKSIVTTFNKLPDIADMKPRVLVMAGEAGDDNQFRITEEYIQFETQLVNLGPLDKLSERELEVLALISHGLTTDEIAARLNRSPKTVEAHRSAITRKLGVKNRIQLSEIAHRARLELKHAKLTRVAI
jgi:DNA-binding CsgD family transcriptional regulator